MAITVYGDSILKGILLENGRYVIDRRWEERYVREWGVSVTNRSRFGCTIEKAMAVIRRDSLRPSGRQDVAVLEFGGNDCDYHWAEIAAAPDKSHSCNTPPARFAAGYREAIRLVRESGREPVVLTLPPIHSERYLDFICRDGLSRENILSWLGDVENIFRWQESYSHLAEQTAREEGVRLIDLRRPFLRRKDWGALLCADGIHPSREGQQLIYDTLCRYTAAPNGVVA
ncbi:MAG: SGNH/GDSL hydrolase family protein [Oscillospiraceae bacterium]|nr:SGNH/GDSL hydrolase family protein [Oscillospiraceae bacterium]